MIILILLRITSKTKMRKPELLNLLEVYETGIKQNESTFEVYEANKDKRKG